MSFGQSLTGETRGSVPLRYFLDRTMFRSLTRGHTKGRIASSTSCLLRGERRASATTCHTLSPCPCVSIQFASVSMSAAAKRTAANAQRRSVCSLMPADVAQARSAAGPRRTASRALQALSNHARRWFALSVRSESAQELSSDISSLTSPALLRHDWRSAASTNSVVHAALLNSVSRISRANERASRSTLVREQGPPRGDVCNALWPHSQA